MLPIVLAFFVGHFELHALIESVWSSFDVITH